jgi:hypothetical protein
VDLFSNYVAFNAHLRWGGFPPNTRLKVTEFKRLRAITNNERDLALDQILQARGYETVFDKRLLLVGDFPNAERLLEFEWKLIEASRDEFIFSDRPIPPRLATSTIALGISARFGICLKRPGTNDANMLLGLPKMRKWPRSTRKCDNGPRNGFVVQTLIIFKRSVI